MKNNPESMTMPTGVKISVQKMVYFLVLLAIITSISVPLGYAQNGTPPTLTNVKRVYSGILSLQPLQTGVACSTNMVQFTASQGQYLEGNFSANNLVTLYVTTQQSAINWIKSPAACQSPPPNQPTNQSINPPVNILMRLNTKSSSFSVSIPQNGNWALLFVGIQADINLTANLGTPQ